MTTVASPVFASAAGLYLEAGWPAVLPVPPETKSPPPTGFTGAEGHDTPAELVASWANGSYAMCSVALRMPDGVIGIDVDEYDKLVIDKQTGRPVTVEKRGAATLARAVEQWGPLPPTWTSTARGNGPSRIAFFRVPPGRYATVIQPHIEIIQRHHRYAVVWPSPHGEIDGVYTWYAPDGTPATRIPRPDELPWLPGSWVSGLAEGATTASLPSASHSSGDALLAMLSADLRPACSVMYDALEAAARVLDDPNVGTRHEAMTERTHRIVQSAAMGHPGYGVALPGLRERWLQLTVGEEREGEFDRMLLSSARKAVTAIGGVRQLPDPCLMLGGYTLAAPAPIDDREGEGHAPLPGPIAAPVIYSWRHIIGTHPFDPNADLDQTLAAEVLARTWAMIRRASDTKSGWLQRGPVQWDLHDDLTRRAIAEVAGLMPKGDPVKPAKGEAPTDEQRRAARRTRFHTNASAGGIAGAMKAIVQGGWHPSAVKLADLDSEPEVLWAGGVPYDLRASRGGPMFAHVELNTPHLASAGVAPEMRETPLWDALLAAVWPDPDVRAWALRVLSITLTGHPDAALPILLGPGGSGKTSTIELIMSVLGSYAHAANVKLLSGESSHDSIIFALKGRRLSFIDEGPREGRWAQERLKQLTGGGMLTGNAMNQNPITFRPTHTLVLTSNTEPILTDEAVRRRVRLIPCTGDAAQVRRARAALTAQAWAGEAPGVLASLMAEAAAWLADPDSALTAAAPESIRHRADEIAGEQDYVTRWVEERCEPFEAGTPASDLYAAFVAWSKTQNVHPGRIASLVKWAERLDELGYTRLPDRRAGRRRPLRVRPEGMFGLVPGPVTGSQGFVTGSDGSALQPVTPHNRSSTPLFASSVTGVTGLETIREENKKDTLLWSSETLQGVQGEYNPQPVTHPSENLAGSAETAKTQPVTPQPDPSPASKIDNEAPATPRSVTKAEAARRAAEDKITKAEARKRVAEENRLAAIEQAAGEYIGLPAVATREGYVMPVTIDQAEAIVRTATARAGALTVDVETSGYPVGHVHHRLRTVQLGDEEAAVVLDPVEHADAIRTLLAEAPKLHAHSAAADLVPLAHAGLIDAGSGWARMFDTVIPAKLADPQSTGSDPGLKQLAGAVLGQAATAPGADEARTALFKAGHWPVGKQKFAAQLTTPPERNGWAQVPSDRATMVRYAASDVLDTAALARRLPEIPPAILERERAAEEMTARVAHRGLVIDRERIAELTEEHTRLRDAAAQRVRAFGAIDNPGSGQQVAAVLQALGAVIPVSAKGNPSVAEHVLSILVRTEPDSPAGQLAAAVLDYRHSNTVLTLFLAPYTALIEHGDGRARPTVYTLGTDTGRMSSVRPNVQQLPREGGVRSIYHAEPDHVFISADFGGVELRGAAALSQDPAMLRLIAEEDDFNLLIKNRALADGVDEKQARAAILAERGWENGGTLDGFHWVVARQAFGLNATKGDRYVAKRGCFGTFYGGGAEGLAKQVGVPVAEMEIIRNSLRAVAPDYFAWADRMRAGVRRGLTQFPAYSGRIIHFPADTPHKAPAYAIQGTCRELLVDALVRWRDTRWGDATLLPVHDELVIQVPAEDADAALAELVRCMEGELYGVKIVAEASEPSPYWTDSV